jgi:archaellum biogenesis ATPase FlaH
MSVSRNKLLSKLVSNVESLRFILISDRLDSNSKQLMDCFITNRLKRFNICLVIVENDPKKYLNSLKQNFQNINNVKIFDYFSKYNSIESNISEDIMKSLSSVSNESIVIMDSLTPLLMTDSLHQICCALNQLSNRFQQLICCLHIDSHSELINQSIERIADCVIQLNKNEDKSLKCSKALIICRKHNRKTHISVQQSIELFNIEDFAINYVNISDKSRVGQHSDPSSSDPTLHLPFNLNLKDDEIKAKNDLLLPYIKYEIITKLVVNYF